MSDAPERIWANAEHGTCQAFGNGVWASDTLYTRADLATPDPMDDPRVLALVEAAKLALDDLQEWLDVSQSLRAAGFNMDDTHIRAIKLAAALAAMKGGA